MKILHVSTAFPVSFPGGITNYVRALATAQAQMGDDIHILARPEQDGQCRTHFKVQYYTPAKVVPFSLKMVEQDPESVRIGRLMRQERYDLVHFHIALDLPLGFLRTFSTLGSPYVVSLHDYSYICPRIFMVDWAGDVCRKVDLGKCRRCVGLLDQSYLLLRASRKLGFVLPRVPSPSADRRMNAMKTFLGNARILLPVSDRTAEIYREVVPEARMIVEQIGNDSADEPVAAKTPSDKIRLSVIGTLNKMKGAEVLEELLKRVRRPDCRFQFYGRVLDGYDKRLSRLGLICKGSYRPEDIPGIMANTDVGLVLPIWEDSGPQVAMEFINNLIPVVGTKRGGVPDIAGQATGFLFDPDDDSDLQRAALWINQLTPDKLKRISAGIKRLRTPRMHAERLSDLYREALQITLQERPEA